ncbi:MAG: hypothetical protein BGO78_12765 [Chloroflexi bacterium 44-23]|nr:MAG: hypothetical protein BGO78_12765 [Chloroflexi bacterium 44-23]
MKRTHPGGIISPLAIPLDSDENLDVNSLKRLIDQILPNLDGLFILGSTGEFAHLTEYVADQFVDIALEHAANRLPTYLGIGDTGTQRVIRNLDRAKRNKVDYVVVTSSYYYSFDDQLSLQEHFIRVAEASPIPVILYNIPQNTHINLTPESVEKLSEHPNIVGLKDSMGDMIQFQDFLTYRSKKFIVMQGREQLAAASLWLGADGIVSALNTFAPQIVQRIMKAVEENDRTEALIAQNEATHLAQIFSQGYWLSGLKAALQLLGYGSGRPASPVPSCTRQQVDSIRKILREHGLLD